jgi:hypothetical protein
VTTTPTSSCPTWSDGGRCRLELCSSVLGPQVAEQNNFAISEFISNKRAESNYEPIKNKVRGRWSQWSYHSQVLKLQWEYNKMLIEALKKP